MRIVRKRTAFKVFLIVSVIITVRIILNAMESVKDERMEYNKDTEGRPNDDVPNSVGKDSDPFYNNQIMDCNFFHTQFGPHRSSFRDMQSTSSETFVSVLRRILINSVRHELEGFADATLLDIPMHANKGDTAITIGELSVLAAFNVTLVHYNNFGESDNANVSSMDATKMVVLGHGGGNIGTWPVADRRRKPELQKYRDFKYVLLSQSAHIYDDKHLLYMQDIYSRHPDVTFLLRDLDSYRLCQQHFPYVHSVLVPDMAFGIGPIGRFALPTMDVIWINRDDKEKNENHKPQFPDGVSYLVSDWWYGWETPKGQNTIEKSYLLTFNGFLFVQRGRVVVTDRLHGLIVSMLLGLPVVILDNKINKLTNYFDTWLRGVDNVLVATSTDDAVEKAMTLLKKVKTPEISPGNKNAGRVSKPSGE